MTISSPRSIPSTYKPSALFFSQDHSRWTRGKTSHCLSETSDVLEILFQFIHPPLEDPQPSVAGLEPNLFFRVAEAAEKYAIFGAKNVCMTWM